MPKTKDAMKIIENMIGEDQEMRDMIEEETINRHIAQLIYDTRTSAGLTQSQLAELAGTSQSAIARLEDADYEGHSLSMLRKIAAVLHKRLIIDFA